MRNHFEFQKYIITIHYYFKTYHALCIINHTSSTQNFQHLLPIASCRTTASTRKLAELFLNLHSVCILCIIAYIGMPIYEKSSITIFLNNSRNKLIQKIFVLILVLLPNAFSISLHSFCYHSTISITTLCCCLYIRSP